MLASPTWILSMRYADQCSVCISRIPHLWFISHPCHPPCINHPDNTRRTTEITQLLQHLAQCNQLGFNKNERLLTFPDVSNATWPSVPGLANFYPHLKKRGVKFTLEQATKVHRGSRGIAILFLQPRRWTGWVVRAKPPPLYPQTTQYPLYRRLSGHQGRAERMRKISPQRGFDPEPFSP
jgi:hypothetical protein